MIKGLKNHTVRVGWQIRRIYRARNMIVHSGITPSYIELLIENIHDYLDHIIGKVISLVTNSQQVITIEQAFKLTSMSYRTLEDTLSDNKRNFDVQLIEEMYSS